MPPTSVRYCCWHPGGQKLAGDYVSTLRYLQFSRAVIRRSGDGIGNEYLLEEAECEFLNGNLAGAMALSAKILATPGKITDKAEAASLMAEIHMRQSDSQMALETALA